MRMAMNCQTTDYKTPHARKRNAWRSPRAGLRPALLLILLAVPAILPAQAQRDSCVTVKDCLAQLKYGESRMARELAAKVLGERGDVAALKDLKEALQGDEGDLHHRALHGGLFEKPRTDALQVCGNVNQHLPAR